MLRFKGEGRSEKHRKHRDQEKASKEPRKYDSDRQGDYRSSRHRSRSRSRSESGSQSRERKQRRDREESTERKDKSKDRADDKYRDRDYDNRNGDDKHKSERLERSRSPRRRDPFAADNTQDPASQEAPREEKKKKKKKEKKPKIAPTAEPMIIVTVNDRLGTKASIPCLASDPIKAFKALVAAQIGREPHEIMLKRQGERPFKDNLTLEDYGVSNGVQLDLEVDTGD